MVAVPGPGWCLCALVACVVAWVCAGVLGLIDGLGSGGLGGLGGLIGGVWPALVVCSGA